MRLSLQSVKLSCLITVNFVLTSYGIKPVFPGKLKSSANQRAYFTLPATGARLGAIVRARLNRRYKKYVMIKADLIMSSEAIVAAALIIGHLKVIIDNLLSLAQREPLSQVRCKISVRLSPRSVL